LDTLHIVAVWSRFTGRTHVRCGHELSRHFDLYGLGGQWRSAARCLASGQSSLSCQCEHTSSSPWRTYEGREDIRSWKRDVADGCDCLCWWNRAVIYQSCRDRSICGIGVAVATAAAVSSCYDDSSCLVVVTTEVSCWATVLPFLLVWYPATAVTSARWSSDSTRDSAEVTFIFLCWQRCTGCIYL